MDGPALADRLVDDHPLRNRWLPDRLAPDDPRQFFVSPVGFEADGGHLVDDHAAQLEVGVVRVPDIVDGVGEAPIPRRPSAAGSTTIRAMSAAISPLCVRFPSD